jgi:hypothetical protein
MVALAVLPAVVPRPIAAQVPAVRDSAGIRIVENAPLGIARAAFALGDKPTIDLSGAENNPDSQFYAQATGYHWAALRLRDGRFLVASSWRPSTEDAKSRSQLMYFDGAGKLLSIVHLPPPFRSPNALCQTPGDTLIIGDTNGRLIGVVDNAGSVVTTIPLNGGSRAESCFGDGTFLAMVGFDLGDHTVEGPPRLHIVSKRTDGSVVHDFGWIAQRAVLSAGASVPSFAARGSQFFDAPSGVPEIRRYNAQGALNEIVRMNDTLLRVTTAQLVRGEGAPPIHSTMPLAEAAPARTWPVYGTAMTDEAGRIWVNQYLRSNDFSPTWTAFGADGVMIGSITVPVMVAGESWRVEAFYSDAVQVSIINGKAHTHRIVLYPLVRVP